MCCGGCTGGIKARRCGARSGDGGSFGVAMAVRLGWMMERWILALAVELTVHLFKADHKSYPAFD